MNKPKREKTKQTNKRQINKKKKKWILYFTFYTL